MASSAAAAAEFFSKKSTAKAAQPLGLHLQSQIVYIRKDQK
jgi:hypothetical protein